METYTFEISEDEISPDEPQHNDTCENVTYQMRTKWSEQKLEGGFEFKESIQSYENILSKFIPAESKIERR